MITITPEAAEQILKSAQEAGLDVACLRLAARLGDQGAIEYGMGFDDKAEDDLQVVARDIKVLISPGSIELLTGATIDYVEINPGELHFIFINPNDPAHKPPGPPR
ncbi:MAG: HesB/IscA family protein [Burkholderiales bacterium]